jgi:protocatechuate 3,4-dioxygenase beta subunit
VLRHATSNCDSAHADDAAVIEARTAANAQNATDVTDAPARLTSSSRIAPDGEPGTPLVVSGIIVGEDGKTPLAGVVVYAYHTDDSGHYRNDGTGAGEVSTRLRGWAKTDSRDRHRRRP